MKRMNTDYLISAIDHIGIYSLAKSLGLTYQAILRWKKRGTLPRTEWTGETAYAEKIEQLSAGKFTKSKLLSIKRA